MKKPYKVRSFIVTIDSRDNAEEQLDQLLAEEKRTMYIREYSIEQQPDDAFPIYFQLCREDLENEGYDASKLTDDDIRNLAEDMHEGFANEFWDMLNYACDKNNISKK